jgi:serine/threonine protein kinase
MAWTSGQKLQDGNYTIEQELGEGGFGITYRARDNNGRKVVIKTLNNTVQRRPDFAKFQQDFLNEALRLARCSHPHIVRVDEVIQEGQLWCMVMEYIDGEDLANWVVKRGVLPEAEALRYIQQIGEALTVVHNNGLLHRDIKPHNIMLRSGKSEAVLIDFGIAREFTQNLTQTHTQYVTDCFAPIEQYDKRSKRGAYTDVYALAATLYLLLTGEVPTIAPLRAIGTPLESPKQINPGISDRMNQAILVGLEVKAENRPQSMQEWLALLDTGFAPTIPSTPQTPSDNLSSAVGIDYRKLRDLLAQGKWQEADRETLYLMLKVFHREKQDSLKREEIDQFPCTDLCTINQLWVKYSNGRFGFTVQKLIYDECGRNEETFGDRVGWRVNHKWLYPSDLTFDLNAPTGHLPGLRRGCYRRGGGLYLFSRVETCNVMTSVNPSIYYQSPPQTSSVQLISGVGVDYSNLRNLLEAGKWQEADRETGNKMLEVAGRNKVDGLRGEDIQRFPCEDLQIIDQLWVNYSNERFGFSVQKSIWESVGGKDKPDWTTFENFGDRLGWRRKTTWLPYSTLNFTKNAPEGHLPVCPSVARWWWRSFVNSDDMIQWVDFLSYLLQRIEACQL